MIHVQSITYCVIEENLVVHVILQSPVYHECCDSQGVCCNMSNPHHCRVLESFRFYDDAMAAYPWAEIVPLNEVALWNEDEEHDFILGGMGLTSSRAMMKSLSPLTSSATINTSGSKAPTSCSPKCNSNDVITVDNEGATLNKSVPGIESLHYLATLALSGQKLQNTGLSEYSRETKNMRKNAYVSELAKIAQSRFASHCSESIRLNINHAMDLFTRCRTPNVGSSSDVVRARDSNLMFDMTTKAGLSLTQSEARALVIAEFPQICLYERHELVERIKFMIAPLSPLMQKEESCPLLLDGKDVLDVDCKC